MIDPLNTVAKECRSNQATQSSKMRILHNLKCAFFREKKNALEFVAPYNLSTRFLGGTEQYLFSC